jgi:hypothetical protein
MSSPVDRAKLDLERINSDIRKLEIERSKVTAFIEMYDHYSTPARQPEVPTAHATSPLFKKDIIAITVENFLKDRGRPAELDTVFEAVKAAGINLSTSTQPKQYVSSVLHKDARFRTVGRQGWWLVGVDLPRREADAAGADLPGEPAGDPEPVRH